MRTKQNDHLMEHVQKIIQKFHEEAAGMTTEQKLSLLDKAIMELQKIESAILEE
jgi:hypothetical protein